MAKRQLIRRAGELRRSLFREQRGRCWYCDRIMTLSPMCERSITLDHFYPLARDGTNARWNLVGACHGCNRQKADMLPGEFLDQLARDIPGFVWPTERRGGRLMNDFTIKVIAASRDAAANDTAPSPVFSQVNRIIGEVAGDLGLNVEDILSERRLGELVEARWAIMYRLRHELGYSYSRIGRLLNRDHSTVIYGIEKVQAHLTIQAARA